MALLGWELADALGAMSVHLADDSTKDFGNDTDQLFPHITRTKNKYSLAAYAAAVQLQSVMHLVTEKEPKCCGDTIPRIVIRTSAASGDRSART